jgi:RHS repeat-associated protein
MNWNPNGSLQSLTIADPFNAADNQTCTYSADDLGRLAGVNCGSTWAQNFSFDPFGNLTKSGSISWQPGYDASTNHYTLGGTSYDADGNVLNDTFNTYTWDVDGKNLSTYYYSFGGQTWSYINDAFGRRVEGAINGTYATSMLTLGKFKLSANGQSPNYSEYPLPGGSVLSQGGGGRGVQLADWLGTIRGAYSYTGGSYEWSSAHAPFGNPSNSTYYFPERFLRSSQGRWLTPDPAGMAAADPSNPQSWNLYAYVMNLPLNLVDPLGLVPPCTNDKNDGIPCVKDSEQVNAPPPDDYSMIFDDARTPGFQHFFRRLECANKFANNHSLAAAFGAQNTFLGKALGGNICGGIGSLVTAVAGRGNFTAQDAALTAYGGASLGIPIPGGHPGLNGAGGIVQDAIVKGATATAVNAFTGASTAPVSVLTGEAIAGTATQISTQALEDVATGVGWLKLAGDAAVYAYGLAQCK